MGNSFGLHLYLYDIGDRASAFKDVHRATQLLLPERDRTADAIAIQTPGVDRSQKLGIVRIMHLATLGIKKQYVGGFNPSVPAVR
jgi:hypothetical protein